MHKSVKNGQLKKRASYGRINELPQIVRTIRKKPPVVEDIKF